MAELNPEIAAACEWIDAESALAYHEAGAAAVPELGVSAARLGGAVAVRAAAFDILMYNRVIALGSGAPAEPDDLDRAIDWFGAAGVPRFMVQVRPGAAPEALADWLTARGFRRHNYWLKLWRDVSLGAVGGAGGLAGGAGAAGLAGAGAAGLAGAAGTRPAAAALQIRAIGTGEAQAFGVLESAAFGHSPAIAPWLAACVGRPGWHHVGAFDGATLAACGALFVGGDLGWIGFASTDPAYRNRGLQSALIVHRIELARALGCRMIAVETAADTPEKPNPSTHNLRRLGFRVLYERVNWVKELAAKDSC